MAHDVSQRVRDLVGPALEAAGFDLEEVEVSRAGSRSVVRIVVDRDGGIDLDAVAVASRAASEVLDADEDVVPGVYVLEVTSPGVDRPLTQPRHWRRNTGRLVTVTRTDGTGVTGRVTDAGDDGATLDVGGVETAVEYADVRRAVVQVEFSRAAAGEDGDDADDVEEDA